MASIPWFIKSVWYILHSPMSREQEEEQKSEKIHCPGRLLPFYLGMTDFNCCGIPEPKRKKLSLSKKIPLSPSSHFNFAVSSEDIEKSSKGCIPVCS